MSKIKGPQTLGDQFVTANGTMDIWKYTRMMKIRTLFNWIKKYEWKYK